MLAADAGQYLLQQGADKEKADNDGCMQQLGALMKLIVPRLRRLMVGQHSTHFAVQQGHAKIPPFC